MNILSENCKSSILIINYQNQNHKKLTIFLIKFINYFHYLISYLSLFYDSRKLKNNISILKKYKRAHITFYFNSELKKTEFKRKEF